MVTAFAGTIVMNRPIFSDCNFIVVADDAHLKGVVAFEDATFQNCEFDCITFIISNSVAEGIRDSANGQVIDFLGMPLD